MAYAATITTAHSGGLRGQYHYSIEETEAATGSEFELTDVPVRGRIVRYTADLTAGTGTVLDPIIGTAANPAATPASVVLENGTAADPIDLQPSPPAAYYAPDGSLFVRNSVDDLAADHVITTKIIIIEGWGV